MADTNISLQDQVHAIPALVLSFRKQNMNKSRKCGIPFPTVGQ